VIEAFYTNNELILLSLLEKPRIQNPINQLKLLAEITTTKLKLIKLAPKFQLTLNLLNHPKP